MFIDLFYKLRKGGVPVSITEYLSLLDVLDKGTVSVDIDGFYYLARTALVKDESLFDRFDQIFGAHFKGAETLFAEIIAEIPGDWLVRNASLELSEEEKQQIEALGGWDKLMETLKQRLTEQDKRHQGGSKMIGTGGTSPFGAYGYNPEGIRIGQQEGRHRRAVKVWDKREFRNLDSSLEIGTRNIKLALRNLRRFARDGATEELDIDATIDSTAKNAGYLDIRMVPERHNTIKVLLFLDAGGSMDMHIERCAELFSAAHSEFRHLEYFYFHNCLYETVWKDNLRRHNERIPTMEIIHKYGQDYKLIFVGDASMSPYEIMVPGGGVEHWNEEPGAVWMKRILSHYPYSIWLNPVPKEQWKFTSSIKMISQLMGQRMFPLTVEGLAEGIETLKYHIH